MLWIPWTSELNEQLFDAFGKPGLAILWFSKNCFYPDMACGRRLRQSVSHPCTEIIHTEICIAKVQWARCDFVYGVANTNTTARWIGLQREFPMLHDWRWHVKRRQKSSHIFFNSLNQCTVAVASGIVQSQSAAWFAVWHYCEVPLPQHWKKYFGAKALCLLLKAA